jgi:hypothetical protein
MLAALVDPRSFFRQAPTQGRYVRLRLGVLQGQLASTTKASFYAPNFDTLCLPRLRT